MSLVESILEYNDFEKYDLLELFQTLFNDYDIDYENIEALKYIDLSRDSIQDIWEALMFIYLEEMFIDYECLSTDLCDLNYHRDIIVDISDFTDEEELNLVIEEIDHFNKSSDIQLKYIV